MKVQRVRHPQSGHVSWFVLDDGYHPISPITAFLTYLAQIERSPHTIRSYAHHLKLYWEYLQDAGLDWKAAGLSELADFVSWLRSPQVRVIGMHEQEARRSEATINVILTAVTMFYEYHARIGTVEEIPLYRSQLQPHRRYKGFLHHISKGKPVRTRLIKLRTPQRMPKTLSAEQVTQLIAACQRRRDRFLISLLYETGMRIGQALGLRHLPRSTPPCRDWPRPRSNHSDVACTSSAYAVRST
jgi:integrase/recombinase XerD